MMKSTFAMAATVLGSCTNARVSLGWLNKAIAPLAVGSWLRSWLRRSETCTAVRLLVLHDSR